MAERGASPRQNLDVRVIGKAMKDEAYRQELIVDPKEVLNGPDNTVTLNESPCDY